MADTLTFLGSKTIAATIPGAMASVAIGEQQLTAQIDALVAFQPAAVSFPDLIGLAERMLADLNTALAIGVVPPSIDAQIAVMAAVVAGLKAQLAIILNFYGLCAAAGVECYVYDGSAAGFGAAMSAATAGGFPSGGGPASHCYALVLATAVSATAGAMAEVFVS
jgi:hypothetical protein